MTMLEVKRKEKQRSMRELQKVIQNRQEEKVKVDKAGLDS